MSCRYIDRLHCQRRWIIFGILKSAAELIGRMWKFQVVNWCMLKRTVHSVLRKPILQIFPLALWYLHSRLHQEPHLELWVLVDLGRMDSLLARLPMATLRIRSLQMLPAGISQTALDSMR